MRQLKINKSLTNRSEESLNAYLVDIGKYELIPIEKEIELAERIQLGDDLALNQLVRANLRFVVSVAKQYQHQGLGIADLINEGNLGLIKAAQRFDHTRGFKFISYAVWWIRQSIMQAINDQSRIVRLPLNKISQSSKVNKFTETFVQENGYKPSLKEISEELDMSEESITNITQRGHTSLDKPIDDGNMSSLMTLFEDTDSPNPEKSSEFSESLSLEIDRVLTVLPARTANILKWSYGIGCAEMSRPEIAEHLGMSAERIRQITDEGLRSLRENSKTSKLLVKFIGC